MIIMQRKIQSYNNIYITGMPGCGKSTFGRIYAHYSKRNFIDFDDFFEKTQQTTIAKVFASKGEHDFRKAESKLLHTLKQHTHSVIALGGGTLLTAENYNLIQNSGIIVSLVGLPIEILAQRILNDKTNQKKRPLFAQCQNFEQILQKTKELAQKRSNIYLKADIILDQFLNSTDNLMLMVRYIEKKFIKC